MSLHRVVGTAGHIDHGKTSLVKALTGIDTDRLKEEQERGITIELGFAHLPLPSGDVVGVVDVPGHERFIRTMVAGAVGIDAVVLVVAADEGVMPQTREHLDICTLLGVRAGVVALSKCDLCEPELRELATMELRETLRGTFLAEAPIVPCSARTGEGLSALVAALAGVLATAPGRDERGLLRLPVDRVFSLRGFGTVATGTLWAGRLRVGDELVPLPGPRPGNDKLAPAKVRGLHVHGAAVPEAAAGQRTAVNLTLPLTALERGETLVRPGTLQAGVLLDARVQLLSVARAPLGRRSRLLVHAGTTQRLGQLTLLDREQLLPGEAALAQIQLDAPLCAQPGDRFVLRGFAPQKNHGTTVGGGLVLRVLGARHRRGTQELCARLQETAAAITGLATTPTAAARALLRLEAQRRGVLGTTLAGLRIAVPVAEETLAAALRAELRAGALRELLAPASGEAGEGGEAVYVSAATLAWVGERLVQTVAAHHKSAPRAEGLPREALRLQLGPLGARRAQASGKKAEAAPVPPAVGEGPRVLCPPRLLAAAVEAQLSAGRLAESRERAVLRLPTHRVVSGDEERALSERVAAVYGRAGLAPPRLDELPPQLWAEATGHPMATTPAPSAPELKQAVEGLIRGGTLVRVKDLLFHRQALDALRGRLVAFLQEHREINPTQWKDLVGQSRKYTIPLAEHFDAEKLTLRVGDLRRLRVGPAR